MYNTFPKTILFNFNDFAISSCFFGFISIKLEIFPNELLVVEIWIYPENAA